MKEIKLTTEIPEELVGQRLDVTLAHLFSDYSRMRLKEWIQSGFVTINGAVCDIVRQKVKLGDRIDCIARVSIEIDDQPEAIPLDIIYQDESIFIINKQAQLVVHPGAGNPRGTLVNALLYHDPALQTLPRAGIIHRLDKGTTGLMVVARTLEAHTKLVQAMQAKEIKRVYEAVVQGVPTAGGQIDAPLGRHNQDRKRMVVRTDGKQALTHYRVLERFAKHAHLQLMLVTGRTHQIRVHMAHIGYPLLGDKTYNKRGTNPPFPRQALHAKRLELVHPNTGELLAFEAPQPQDFKELIKLLRDKIKK